jgi:hypothetical protein
MAYAPAPTMALSSGALRQLAEALLPRGVVLLTTPVTNRRSGVEDGLPALHSERQNGWAVSAYAFVLRGAKKKDVAPADRIEVFGDSTGDQLAACRAIVEALGAQGVSCRWSGAARDAIVLEA